MILQDFLKTFLNNYPQSRLVVLTKHNRDYFINVVPLLFHIDVVINNRNQMLEPVVIDYDNDITLNMDEKDVENLTKVQFSLIAGDVVQYEGGKTKTNVDITLPLDFFKFLTA